MQIRANCANFGAGANSSRFAIKLGIFMRFCDNVAGAKAALVLNFVLFACLVWYWLLESDLAKVLMYEMFW